MKKVLSVLLIALLALQLLPGAALAAGEGSFVFAAFSSGESVVAPTRVSYAQGQSIRQALAASPYEFTGLDTGYIDSIAGVAASYFMTDENGAYSLDRPASDIECFVFYGSALTLHEGEHGPMCDMVTAMAEMNEATNGVRNYQPARAAYLECQTGMLHNGSDFTALAAALRAAMTDFEENVLGAPAQAVSLAVKSLTSGSAVTGWTLSLTDIYGSSCAFTSGEAIALRADTYDFELTKDQYAARGSMTVGTDGSVTIGGNAVSTLYLYDGEWIGDVLLHNTSGDMENGVYEHTAVSDGWEYLVPDTDGTGVFCWIVKGSGIDGSTFTASNVKCFPVYETIDGVWEAGATPNKRRSWESSYDVITKSIRKDDTPALITLEARYDHADGYTIVQSRALHIERTPTLRALTVLSGGAAQEFGFASPVTEYSLDVSSSSLVLAPEPTGSYTVTVNGEAASASDPVTVALPEGVTDVTAAVVSSAGRTTEYVLHVNRVEAVTVTVNHPAGTTVLVENGAGALLGPESSTDTADSFLLVPGTAYSAVATKNGHYHTRTSFTAADGLAVTAAEPIAADWMTGLTLRSRTREASSDIYLARSDFDPAIHEYEIGLDDVLYSFYAAATASRGTVTAVEPGKTITNTASNIATSATNINRYLEAGDAPAAVTFRVTDTVSGVDYYQDYTVSILRRPTLTAMTLLIGGESVYLYRVEDGEVTSAAGFDDEIHEYQANILRAADGLTLEVETYLPGYCVTVDGTEFRAPVDEDTGEPGTAVTVTLPLDSYLDSETAELCVHATHEAAQTNVYSVTLVKRDALNTAVVVTDGTGTALPDALAAVYDTRSGDRVWPGEDGLFPLVDGMEYRIVSTCVGCVGDERTVTVTAETGDITVALAAAPETDWGEGITSDWPSFRGGDDSNGVISAKTPVTAETAMLSWASKLGDGYSSEAVSCPILITEDGYDYLIVYAGDWIYKVDAISGETVLRKPMDHSSSFAINSPTFGGGMIFVGLSGGGVQAFDAASLDSLWLYRDELGGQPNCPITYRDGYVYTGFWNSEAAEANYVCLSVTDEDPSNDKEQKLASWTVASVGGYYWAGCYVTDDYLLVGTDDGHTGCTSETASLLCLDPKTGALLDSLTGLKGDVRSSICRDAADGRFYFTTKGGCFYSVMTVTDGDGTRFDRDSLRRVFLQNGAGEEFPAMSSCTPVVYNGRAYIGVSGAGQFTAYSGHSITVIDLRSWTVAYSVATQGYPQTSGLLTDGYDDGEVYVYFFDNYTPGKLRVLRDQPGQTEPDLVTLEEHTVQGSVTVYTTPYVLFTPSGAQAQYAICSPISDDYGVIYFKNDSANLMALSNTIASLEVVTPPDKTEYAAGELFDGTGMEILVTYENGTSRVLPASREAYGVTLTYFTWSEEPLTEDDTTFFVRFAHTMYQNNGEEIGYPYLSPAAAVQLTITSAAACSITAEAPEPMTVTAGEMLELELSGLFTDSAGHALTYTLEGDFGEHTRIAGSRLFFSQPEPGVFAPVVAASCAGGESASVTLSITVEPAPEGLDLQYGYNETDADSVTVYVTVSSDGLPILNSDGDETLALLPVTVPYFDLGDYGLEDYYRYHTDGGSGPYTDDTVIRRPTALHLYIWLLQRYYMGLPESQCGPNGSDNNPLDYCGAGGVLNMEGGLAFEDGMLNALNITGSATSMYMSNFWGHDENLMYYRNHVFPLMSPGWGSTADYILLSDGDTIDLAMFSNWDFYKSGAFITIADGSGRTPNVLSAGMGEEIAFSTVKFGTGSVSEGGSASFAPVTGLNVEVFSADWQPLDYLHSDTGSYTCTFQQPGTYYILATDPAAGETGPHSDACLAPGVMRVDVREAGSARVVSASLTLSGEIGVNYYVSPDASLAADPGAYAVFTCMGEDSEPILLTSVPTDENDGVTRYIFTRKVAAKEMTELITLRLYAGNGTPAELENSAGEPIAGNAAQYSVARWCGTVTSANGRALAAKLGNFGARAMTYFSYVPHTPDAAYQSAVSPAAVSAQAADLAAYRPLKSGSVTGLSVTGISLTLESATAVNLSFTLGSGHAIGEYAFSVNGQPASAAYSGGRYYIRIPDIAAKELDTVQTVTVTRGSEALTVTCSGLSFAYNTLKNYPNVPAKAALCELARALYAYSAEADTYFAR